MPTVLIIWTCSTNPQIISSRCTSKICTAKMVPGITFVTCYPVYICHGILVFTTHAIIFRFGYWKDFQRETIMLNLCHECVVHVCTFSCYWIRYSLWRDVFLVVMLWPLPLPLPKHLKQLLNQMIDTCTNQMFFLHFANVPHSMIAFPEFHLMTVPVRKMMALPFICLYYSLPCCRFC